jgi:uncharacterized membrane protein
MGVLMWINVGLAVVNAALALVVTSVYARNHREIGSPITLGLSLFGSFFMVHNGLVAYHYLARMGAFLSVGEAWLLVEGLLQAAGLAALSYATLR